MKHVNAFGGVLGILSDTHQSLKESRKPNQSLNSLKMKWALNVLRRINARIQVIGEPCPQNSVLFLGNHISYLDIPLLLGNVDGISFVAKHELSRWPLFGPGAKQMDTVFVKRNNDKSRNSAKLSVQAAIESGKRVVIFPSGTTSMTGEKMWKRGAFDIAKNTGCKVQPFRITYSPLREVAYIDKDFFPVHLFKLNSEKSIQCKIEFHEPITISNPIEDCLYWSQWASSPF